jgi:2-polyprenyl-3-methyl-5-hydroxy-6-metoxy-1,4-benzoquinol methylase
MCKEKMTQLESFWYEYYKKHCRSEHGQPLTYLDYSNERVQAQSFGLALEAAGPIRDRRCLDIGCGWGQLALCLHFLGGMVVAIDIVDEMTGELRERYPYVKWVTGSFLERSVNESLGNFDVILAIEVLQYAKLVDAMNALWPRLDSGGRMVGVVPNANCPIVQRTISRFKGYYCAVAPQSLANILSQLPSLDTWALRGLAFKRDQGLLPYQITPWTRTWELLAVPNRLMFVVQKR